MLSNTYKAFRSSCMLRARYYPIAIVVAALFLSPKDSEAQTFLRVTGGEDVPLRGGTLFSLHGCRYTTGTGGLPETILHILYAVPNYGRGRESGGGGSDTRYVLTAAFRTTDGRILAADTVFVLNGERVQMGRASFDLAVGNLFVVYVTEGPDSIRQVDAQLIENIDVAARLAVFQQALPGDSVVQAMAQRYKSYGPSPSGLNHCAI